VNSSEIEFLERTATVNSFLISPVIGAVSKKDRNKNVSGE
jgi:hypothetical protein